MTAASPAHTNEFRLVVDAQIALAMFLVRRDRPTAVRVIDDIKCPAATAIWADSICASLAPLTWHLSRCS
jgi:hypothetical protein